MMKKNKFIELVLINSASLFLILVVTFFAAFAVKTVQDNFDQSENNRQGEARISPSVLPKKEEIILPKVLYNLSGPIISLEGDSIVFSAAVAIKDPSGKIITSAETRKAIVGPNAKINKLSFANNSPVEASLNFNNLKAGDYIEVIADHDISSETEFSVTQIRVLP